MDDIKKYLSAYEITQFDDWEAQAQKHKLELAKFNFWRRQMMDRARARQRRGQEPR